MRQEFQQFHWKKLDQQFCASNDRVLIDNFQKI